MDAFDCYGELLHFIGRGSCTRSSVERIKHGFFKDKLDIYVRCRIIQVSPAPDPRDDKLSLTNKGLALWRHEMTIEEATRRN